MKELPLYKFRVHWNLEGFVLHYGLLFFSSICQRWWVLLPPPKKSTLDLKKNKYFIINYLKTYWLLQNYNTKIQEFICIFRRNKPKRWEQNSHMFKRLTSVIMQGNSATFPKLVRIISLLHPHRAGKSQITIILYWFLCIEIYPNTPLSQPSLIYIKKYI